jgi:hypothetical protein
MGERHLILWTASEPRRFELHTLSEALTGSPDEL